MISLKKANLKGLNEPHCTIQVSSDKMNVHLSLLPDGGAHEKCALDASSILRQLEAAGIVVGIDIDAVNEAVNFFLRNPDNPKQFLIAAGFSPEDALPVHLLFNETPLECVEGENDNSVSRPVMAVPLVHPETILAEPIKQTHNKVAPQDVYGSPVSPSEEVLDRRAVQGDNVEYCRDTGTFKATASGYPAIEKSFDNGAELFTISVVPILHIAPDSLSARLSLRPPPPDVPPPNMEELLAVLDRERVVYGRLTKQLERCLKSITETKSPMEVTAAMGIKPRDGIDAKLNFFIEVGPLPGTVRGDGSIDFRERKMFVGVGEGELIAVKIPPTQGKAGKNIHGDEVPQKPGKDIDIKVTDDAAYDPETGEIRAARDGVLSLVTENSVKVCAKQVVSGDVDYNIGNIISRDAVEISGSVRPKFKVIAVGDITIGGNVEKAGIRSDANVIIKGGILGSRSRVQARGDVDIPFLEHGWVVAGGNIILRKSCYYCRLHSRKDIFCPPEARIIASQVVSAGSLTLGNVGADNADKAIIGAAVDPDRLQLYYDYRRVKLDKQEEYNQVRQLLGADSGAPAFIEAQQKLEAASEALNRLNMIPDTPADEDQRSIVQLPQEEITVHGTIFRGTELRIGNTVGTLEETMSKVRFHLTYACKGETGKKPSPRITVTPLKGKKQEELLCL